MNKVLMAALGCVMAVTACSAASSDPEPTQDTEVMAAPAAHFDGMYKSTDENATFVVLDFIDGEHYRGWRMGGGTCVDLPAGSEMPADCAEEGTYSMANEKLTLVDTRTGRTTSFGYKVLSVDDASLGSSSIAPREALITAPSQLLVAGQVQLLNQNGDKENMQRSRIPGIVCRAACWGVAGLGTAAVAVVCTAGTVVTVGGVAVPCTVAILAAAAGLAAGASICADAICPQ